MPRCKQHLPKRNDELMEPSQSTRITPNSVDSCGHVKIENVPPMDSTPNTHECLPNSPHIQNGNISPDVNCNRDGHLLRFKMDPDIKNEEILSNGFHEENVKQEANDLHGTRLCTKEDLFNNNSESLDKDNCNESDIDVENDSHSCSNGYSTQWNSTDFKITERRKSTEHEWKGTENEWKNTSENEQECPDIKWQLMPRNERKSTDIEWKITDENERKSTHMNPKITSVNERENMIITTDCYEHYKKSYSPKVRRNLDYCEAFQRYPPSHVANENINMNILNSDSYRFNEHADMKLSQNNATFSDEPLDLSMPVKKSNNFNISNLLEKHSHRHKRKHKSKKHKRDSCKSLSKSLHSLEKFGKEFNFTTAGSQLRTDEIHSMMTSPSSNDVRYRSHEQRQYSQHSALNLPSMSFNSIINNSMKSSVNNGGSQYHPVKPNDVSNTSSKLTTYNCSCGHNYTTLHDLSRHVLKTGHKPISRRVSIRDYPKLVRGQDMWLNRGSEQTKKILRCIQCDQSFKSLPELTVHMMETQHYEKIVSSNQLKNAFRCPDYGGEYVFKCKVCNVGCKNMDDLSGHMVESGHHSSSLVRGTTTNLPSKFRRKRQFTTNNNETEKRKTSTSSDTDRQSPLRNHRPKSTLDVSMSVVTTSKDDKDNLDEGDACDESDNVNDRKITCENCEEKIEMSRFVDHVRLCLRIKSDTLQVKTERSDDDDCKEFLYEKSLVENDSKRFKMSPTSEFKSCRGARSPSPPELERHTDTVNSDNNPAMDIIDPESGSENLGSGSIQAMESLIHASFGSKTPKNATYDAGLTDGLLRGSYHSLVNDDHEFTSTNMILESMSKISNRFLDNFYKTEEKDKNDEICEKSTNEKLREIALKSDVQRNVELKTDSREIKQEIKTESIGYADSSLSETDTDLRNKYLMEDDIEDTNSNDKSSALDSLSSFVYGQKLTSEHPLERLEKMKTLEHCSSINGTQSPFDNPLEKLKLYAQRNINTNSESENMKYHIDDVIKKRCESYSPKVRHSTSPRSNIPKSSPKPCSSTTSSVTNGRLDSGHMTVTCPVCKMAFVSKQELMLHFINTRCYHDPKTYGPNMSNHVTTSNLTTANLNASSLSTPILSTPNISTRLYPNLSPYKSLFHPDFYSYSPFMYMPLEHSAIFAKYNSALKQ